MDDSKKSCIDCTIGSCNLKDSPFPVFCTTVHMDDRVLHEAMDLDQSYLFMENSKHDMSQVSFEIIWKSGDLQKKMK